MAFIIKVELFVEWRRGHDLALTTHLRPMNFAQIWFSPTDSLNGKSMGARDSTSLKGNVSKCQLLRLRSSLPESAMRAIHLGLYGVKAKDSLTGLLLAQGTLAFGSPSLSMQAQPNQAC